MKMKMDRMAPLMLGIVAVVVVVWLVMQAQSMMSQSFERLDDAGMTVTETR